jgi:hypothetical protein
MKMFIGLIQTATLHHESTGEQFTPGQPGAKSLRLKRQENLPPQLDSSIAPEQKSKVRYIQVAFVLLFAISLGYSVSKTASNHKPKFNRLQIINAGRMI